MVGAMPSQIPTVFLQAVATEQHKRKSPLFRLVINANIANANIATDKGSAPNAMGTAGGFGAELKRVVMRVVLIPIPIAFCKESLDCFDIRSVLM